MRNALTQRSLSNKRLASCNQTVENIEQWDNAGLANSRLNSLQKLKIQGPVMKKYQGDRLIEHKRKSTYDDTLMLPQLDYSIKLNSTLNQAQISIKKQPQPQQTFASPIKKEIKSDKIKLLVMLSQLRKEYQKDQKPSQNVCLLVQEILDNLQKQDNIYGEDMKLLFSIINEMIFCVQQDIIECIQKIQSPQQRKQSDNYFIKPYFEYVELMKVELEKYSQNQILFKKEHDLEIIQLQNQIKQFDQRFSSAGESQKKEIEYLENTHQEDVKMMQQKIDNLNEDLQRAIKENSMTRELLEKWKSKFEDQEKKFIDQISSTTNFQNKYQLQIQISETQKQSIESLEVQIVQLTREKEELEEQICQMTPKPKFNFHDLFEPMGLDGQVFNLLSSNDKVDLIKEKMEEKLQELTTVQEQLILKSPKKKGGSRVLSVLVSTKRQNSLAFSGIDEKRNELGSQKSLDKSPRRKPDTKIKQEFSPNSPSSLPKSVSKDRNPSQIQNKGSSLIKRNLKKAQTLIVQEKNIKKDDTETRSIDDSNYKNMTSLKHPAKSQVFFRQASNLNQSQKQNQEEKRVQFKTSSVKIESSESLDSSQQQISKNTINHS